MAKKFKSTHDMYQSKARDRRRRGASMGGCLVSIIQMLSIVAITVFALAMIF